MEKLRSCKVKRGGSIFKRAMFHRFADSVGYADERQIPVTEAIVEFEDGQLEKVDPDLIKFDAPASDSD